MQSTISLKQFHLVNKPTLILSSGLLESIRYAHKRVGNIEYSGFLLYKKISGDFNSPGELVFKADHFFPLDVGTSGYTEYETDSKVMDMWDMIPDAKDYITGWCHTHHSMSKLFS